MYYGSTHLNLEDPQAERLSLAPATLSVLMPTTHFVLHEIKAHTTFIRPAQLILAPSDLIPKIMVHAPCWCLASSWQMPAYFGETIAGRRRHQERHGTPEKTPLPLLWRHGRVVRRQTCVLHGLGCKTSFGALVSALQLLTDPFLTTVSCRRKAVPPHR